MATHIVKQARSKKKVNYEYPVLVVSRSNKHISIQLLEPVTKKTLATVSSASITKVNKTDKSKKVGEDMAKILQKKKITKAVFDRNGYLYHGRIKALADAIRESGIEI